MNITPKFPQDTYTVYSNIIPIKECTPANLHLEPYQRVTLDIDFKGTMFLSQVLEPDNAALYFNPIYFSFEKEPKQIIVTALKPITITRETILGKIRTL